MSAALLLAEPEPGTRGFLERHLAEDGFRVLAAEPTDLVDQNGSSPDLVLLGDSSVLEACRSWNRDIPVIVLGSPGSDTVDRVRAFERGCDDWVDRLAGALSAGSVRGWDGLGAIRRGRAASGRSANAVALSEEHGTLGRWRRSAIVWPRRRLRRRRLGSSCASRVRASSRA